MNEADIVDRFRRWSLLQAESSGLSWKEDGKRIQEIARELDEIERAGRLFDRNAPAAILPLFYSVDDSELAGAYSRGERNDVAWAANLLDLFAQRVTEDAPISIGSYDPVNWHALLAAIGVDVVDPCCEALASTLATARVTNVRHEMREWPVDDDGEEIVGEGKPPLLTAHIDTDDPRFEERGFVECAMDDDHATSIVRFDIDESQLATVFEIIEQRGTIAKRVLRGVPIDA